MYLADLINMLGSYLGIYESRELLIWLGHAIQGSEETNNLRKYGTLSFILIASNPWGTRKELLDILT